MGANGNSLPAFVTHPLSMVGSDAVLLGDFPSPRTYGCFPVILSEYVREENQMSLPNAIRKMTSFPAQRLGLHDRGILRDGMKADITVFSASNVKAPASRTEPKQFPIGIPYVIVNGTVVIDNSEHTGALPGRFPRPPPGAGICQANYPGTADVSVMQVTISRPAPSPVLEIESSHRATGDRESGLRIDAEVRQHGADIVACQYVVDSGNALGPLLQLHGGFGADDGRDSRGYGNVDQTRGHQ